MLTNSRTAMKGDKKIGEPEGTRPERNPVILKKQKKRIIPDQTLRENPKVKKRWPVTEKTKGNKEKKLKRTRKERREKKK